jgi:hypothetical protein
LFIRNLSNLPFSGCQFETSYMNRGIIICIHGQQEMDRCGLLPFGPRHRSDL